eukprot:TRINITY_DN4210_c0_g1_i1.p1 TRINITY_DN4210_c0_g1~~TRINITY_DN4210_c0_g1_i1.p1  ORF type:complete len:398 (+),score=95.61 TRINITY_DN4210_c0_g1_i1:159-1352(+)
MPALFGLEKVKLKPVPKEELRDRSAANVTLAGADSLADEADRWKYFFQAGCTGWLDAIQEHTFRSTFVDLLKEEAAAIVTHWERRQRAIAAAEATGKNVDAELEEICEEARCLLQPLIHRLDVAVRTECAASSAGKAFVKLSTRSPKDSRKALAKARTAYESRLSALGGHEALDDNERWKILSEEVTNAGAVTNGSEAVEMLLDSERIFEDLEYALRGPKSEQQAGIGQPEDRAYDMSLVARSWDPRLTLQSEFRGIVWEGQLTCLCQYFHPLFFPDLPELKSKVQADCCKTFALPAVQKAVKSIGNHCIIDFAWLGPDEVIIVELNPFDGVCMGTFPASTGLFLWDDVSDRAVMKGEAPFEFRIREGLLSQEGLKAQCNPDWRRIIYQEGRLARSK